MIQKSKRRQKGNSFRKQILITVLLVCMIAFETLFLVLNSSKQLVSSVSDMWQGQLESRSRQVADTLLYVNQYLNPDSFYLAKMEPSFYGDDEHYALAGKECACEYGMVSLAISNICVNIKKGLSYSSSLRSSYWMLEDEKAPYVLINGTPTPYGELDDTAWIDTCRGMSGDILMEWRSVPLSYLNNKQYLTVYRRFSTECIITDRTISGYWVMNYDLPNMLNSFMAGMIGADAVLLVDTRLDRNISVGNLALSDDERQRLLDKANDAKPDSPLIGIIRTEQGEDLYYRCDSLYPGMLSIVCMKNQQFSQALNSTMLAIVIALLISGAAIVCINIYSMLRSRKYYSGLRKMFDTLRNQERGIKDIDGESSGSEELMRRVLNNEVDLEELQGLVESKRELKAELDALYGHVQINSHFLLNTLDSIYWSSVSHTGAFSRESAMIGDLCEILKYALDSSDLFTSLEEEAECAKKYVELQQMRKNIRLEVEWNIPPELNNAQVGKLILQPVIENCIQHGFRADKNKDAHIRITAEKGEDGYLRINVEDNGHGISGMKLRQMNSEMQKQRYLRSRHIGIANVNRRLQVQFGEGSGISLHNISGSGLCVCLAMKYSVYAPAD